MKNQFVSAFVLLAAMSILSTPQSFASGGPDTYGYTWKTSLDANGPVYNWVDITSRPGVQTVTGLADDNSAASMFNIGFNFHFYLNDYSQLKIGSNGWMSFNTISNFASCFPGIPLTGGTGDNLLAPFMCDLIFNNGAGNPGQVKFWTNNSDSCVVSYLNVPFWMSSAPQWTGSNTFQVILCAADSSVTFQYGSVGTVINNSGCVDMSVGIENNTGEIGLQVFSDVTPPSNFAIKFDYPEVVLLNFRDPITRWNSNTGNKAVFIPQNVPYTLVSDYVNVGNVPVTTTIDLQASVLNEASVSVYNSTGTLNGLAAGEDTIFAFPNVWTPTATGQYTHSATLTNAQEANSGNNTKNTELEVVDICATTMVLSYLSSGTPDGSVNWNAGAMDDGVGVYFEPPVYPYTISTIQFYISSNGSDGYIAQVYDDDGVNGGPGTLLFTQTVPFGSVITSAWNDIPLVSPLTLNDGGFYVAWLQGGTGIHLGSETAGPRSLRNYEILEGAWAQYRDDPTKDVYIRAIIEDFADIPQAGFSETTNLLDANFTDNSTGIYKSWSWDFGDGNTSLLQNPSHTYLTAGTYTVCLTATTPCGTDTECHQVMINNTALPLELLDFNVSPLNQSVLAEWQTETEFNNDYFVIERSVSGTEWEVAGTVKSAGNSNQFVSYSFLDEKPFFGLSYYRLKQVDFDGSHSYSDLRSVVMDYENRLALFPNPSNGKIITPIRKENLTDLKVCNLHGQDLTHLVEIIGFTETGSILDISRLTEGAYLVYTRERAYKVIRSAK